MKQFIYRKSKDGWTESEYAALAGKFLPQTIVQLPCDPPMLFILHPY